jgi:hypothetical protein
MDKKDKLKYRKCLDELLKKQLFSYPFYDKSDDELIFDAKERSKKEIEFGLFILGRRSTKTVVVDDKIIDSKILPLISTSDETQKPTEIKISTFMFPTYFFSSIFDNKESISSTLNYQNYNDYGKFYSSIEKYYGEIILVTTYWHTLSDFCTFVNCANIMTTPKDESSLANLIRECFVKDRTNFITDIINKPQKYISFCPIDVQILSEVMKEYQHLFEEELNRLENYKLPPNNVDSDNSYYDSADDLARDYFYAMTDGLEGDYPSRYENDDDNDC